MQFRDLQKQYTVLKDKMDQAIMEVVASSAYVMGPKIKELESALADYVGVKHCVACNSGTDALLLALKAWDVKAGDAVFVPSFTFFASAEVIAMQGATPVFVDVDAETFNMDVDDLERKIGQTLKAGKLKPRVVIAVDLFGLPADFASIRKLADKHGLLVLEDGAQGFGGRINGKEACSFGDISTTSFFPAKPLGCYGDGGAVFTDNEEWAALIDSYRVHGKGQFKYDNVRIGLNSRLDTVQAAVLQVKLKAFADYELDAVNEAAEHYSERMRGLATPVILEGFRSSWAQYTVRFADRVQRDAVQSALKAASIPAMVYYPKPMHLQMAFAGLQARPCPIATSLCERVLSLPMHPYITVEEIDSVCGIIRQALQ